MKTSTKVFAPDIMNTLIGEGTSIRGDIQTTGQVRLDGDLIGNLSTNGQVIVSQSGRAKANISCREAIVGGIVKGDIVATEKVTIRQSGLVIGKILAPRLEVEMGALLEGLCHITPRVKEYGAEFFYQPGDYYSVEDRLKQVKAASEADRMTSWNG